jgi:hypothetical protein
MKHHLKQEYMCRYANTVRTYIAGLETEVGVLTIQSENVKALGREVDVGCVE